MKIGIIGAGKVGVTLGKYLAEAGMTVTGYYSRTTESADSAATFTNTGSFGTLESLVQASDTLFVTTPDGAIRTVWDYIAEMDLTDYIICHFSGSLSSNVFSGIEQTGASGCSIHPMYAFSDRYTSYQNFHTACLTMEGDLHALHSMQSLFEQLGHKIFTLQSADKIKYHAAASIASNMMLVLMQSSLDILQRCGFSEQDSMELLRPLVEENITSMLDKGCSAALTGPVERGDTDTVRKHLAALKDTGEGEIYRSLLGKLISIAQKKNPDRDYNDMRALLQERERKVRL